MVHKLAVYKPLKISLRYPQSIRLCWPCAVSSAVVLCVGARTLQPSATVLFILHSVTRSAPFPYKECSEKSEPYNLVRFKLEGLARIRTVSARYIVGSRGLQQFPKCDLYITGNLQHDDVAVVQLSAHALLLPRLGTYTLSPTTRNWRFLSEFQRRCLNF